jgi:hypothetical protein
VPRHRPRLPGTRFPILCMSRHSRATRRAAPARPHDRSLTPASA